MERGIETLFLINIQKEAVTRKEHDEIIDKYMSQRPDWGAKITEYMEGIRPEELAILYQVSPETMARKMNSWKRGKLPSSRKDMLLLILALEVSEEQADELLVRYGEYPRLYVKNPSDAIVIYMLTNGKRSKAEFEQYHLEFWELLAEYQNSKRPEQEQGYDTLTIQKSLDRVRKDEQFRQFMAEKMPDFFGRYDRLIREMNEWISLVCYMGDRKPVSYDGMQPDAAEQEERNMLYAFQPYLQKIGVPEFLCRQFGKRKSEMVALMYGNRQRYPQHPSRNYIIMFGLLLWLSEKTIDELLLMAGMEPLLEKRPLESDIRYALACLEKAAPEYLQGTDTGDDSPLNTFRSQQETDAYLLEFPFGEEIKEFFTYSQAKEKVLFVPGNLPVYLIRMLRKNEDHFRDYVKTSELYVKYLQYFPEGQGEK